MLVFLKSYRAVSGSIAVSVGLRPAMCRRRSTSCFGRVLTFEDFDVFLIMPPPTCPPCFPEDDSTASPVSI